MTELLNPLWPSMPTIWVDFNGYDNGKIGTTLWNSSPVFPKPERGNVVRLQDDGGMSCWARVDKCSVDYLDCTVVPGTFRDPVIFRSGVGAGDPE